MKKYILSLLLIFGFGAYILYQRSTPTVSADKNVIAPSPNPADSKGSTFSGSQIVYKDGIYTGNVADAYYGNVQVKATIAGGKIADVQFLQYPNDQDTSVEINRQAMPRLKSEAIKAQNSKVDIVSGATQTSIAFRESLKNALVQAQ